MNDERICIVFNTKKPEQKKPMRYSTSQNIQTKRKGWKVANRPGTQEQWILTPQEVDEMHKLKDGAGNDFIAEYKDAHGNIAPKQVAPVEEMPVEPKIEPKEELIPTQTALEILKKEAERLGIKYHKNIGVKALEEKIKEAKDGK